MAYKPLLILLLTLTISAFPAHAQEAEAPQTPDESPEAEEADAVEATAETKDSAEEPEEKAEPKEAPEDPLTTQLGRVAHLQVLNKITARNSVLKIKAGASEKFGNIDIIVKDCWKAPPEEKPEVATLLEVFEEKKGEDRTLIFNGWMFASSPAISALEHPVYDIVVQDCAEWKGE